MCSTKARLNTAQHLSVSSKDMTSIKEADAGTVPELLPPPEELEGRRRPGTLVCVLPPSLLIDLLLRVVRSLLTSQAFLSTSSSSPLLGSHVSLGKTKRACDGHNVIC